MEGNEYFSFIHKILKIICIFYRLANRTVVDNGVSLGGHPRGNNHGNSFIDFNILIVYQR